MCLVSASFTEMTGNFKTIFKKTAAYGHFGRNEPEFTWEKTDRAKVLRKDAGL